MLHILTALYKHFETFMLDCTDDMYLNYTFEEEFGEDISSILSKRIALKVSQSVVSLASFDGDCTAVWPYVHLYLFSWY